MSELPDHIYKYMKLNQHFFDLISNCQLYFSSPSDFNDPFDSKLYVNPISKSDDLESFIKKYPGFEPLDELYSKNEPQEARASSFRYNFTKSLQTLVDNTGICCFSADPSNLLLWSHYADCHKGVCIKFNTKILKETFTDVFPVAYSEEFLKIDFLTDFFVAIQTASFFKSMHWQYEKEIRIKEANKGCFKFKPGAIEELIFGIKAQVPFDFLRSLKDFGYGKVKFTETTQNTSEYKIHYNRGFEFAEKESDKNQ